MRHTFCLTLLLAASSLVHAMEYQIITIAGITFPSHVRQCDTVLEIRGGGKASFLGFSLYSAAFYLESDVSTDRDELFLGTNPKQLRIEYMREIPKDAIVEAAEKGILKNRDNDVDALRERLDKIYDAFHDVEKGDVYVMEYCPEQGTTLYFNGEKEINLPGQDFARAFFGIWLAEDCLSPTLRRYLLDPMRIR